MTSTSDSKSHDPPISSTDKVAPIIVPVTDTSIIASVGPSLTKSLINQFSSTTKVASISVLPNLLIVEHLSTLSTKFIGPLVSSKVTIPSTILPKSSSIDKVNSSSTTSVDLLPSSTFKLTTIIDSNSSIFEKDVSTSTPSVAYMDISVSHLEIEPGYYNEIRLYELQVKITCTISELISIMLSQNDINVSHYRVMLVFCGKHLKNFNVNDKLSDKGIKQDSVIAMMIKCIMAGEMSNSVPYNKKRPVYDNLVKDVKSDKRIKCHKPNVKNDESKDQSLDDIPK